MKSINIGDVVILKEEEMTCLGECYGFERIPYTVECISGNCITKLSGHECSLHIDRFELINQTYEIY